MDELDDPLNEKKRQKIIEEADRKLDNLLQEHKQTAFAEKIIESAEADEKKIPLKRISSTTSKWLLPITPRTELRQQWIES